MKKLLLLLVLFMPLIYVNASYSSGDCGIYKDSIYCPTCTFHLTKSGDAWNLYIDNPSTGGVSTTPLLDFNTTSCPSTIYRYHPQNEASVPIYSVINQSGYIYNGKTYDMVSTMPLISEVDPEPTIPLNPSDKYKDLEICSGGPYEYIQECGCIPSALTDLTSRVFNLIKIVAPVLLLIVGGFDLIKAVTAADEKSIQKEQTKLIKKFVAAFVIFLLFTVVQMLVGLISKDAEGTLTCIDYIVNGYKA